MGIEKEPSSAPNSPSAAPVASPAVGKTATETGKKVRELVPEAAAAKSVAPHTHEDVACDPPLTPGSTNGPALPKVFGERGPWLAATPTGATIQKAVLTGVTVALPPLGLGIIGAAKLWSGAKKLFPPLAWAQTGVESVGNAVYDGVSSAAEVVTYPVRSAFRIGKNIGSLAIDTVEAVTISPLLYLKESLRRSVLHLSRDNDGETLLTGVVNLLYEVGVKFPSTTIRAVLKAAAQHPGWSLAGVAAAIMTYNNPAAMFALINTLLSKGGDLLNVVVNYALKSGTPVPAIPGI